MMTKAKRIALFNLLLFKMTRSIKTLTFIMIVALSARPPISYSKSSTVIMAQNQATIMDNKSIVQDTNQLMYFGQQIQLALSPSKDYDKESTMLLFRDDPTPFFQPESSALLNDKMTYDDYITLSMKSILAVAGYDNDLHRYDNHKDLVKSIPSVSSGNNNNIKPIGGNSGQDPSEVGGHLSEYVMLMRQQRQCGLHLDLLLSQHRKLTSNFKSYSQSTNLNLIELIDSFGSPQDSTMRGSFNWLGSYEQCLSAKIYLPVFSSQSSTGNESSSSGSQASNNKQNDDQQQQNSKTNSTQNNSNSSILPLTPSSATLVNSNLLSTSVEHLQRQRSSNVQSGYSSLNNVKQIVKTRYCIASFRSPNWMNNSLSQDYPGSFSIKIGICLPETCNSLSLRSYRSQLERLIKSTRLTLLPYSEYNLIGLYCLPDEGSELRQLSLSAKSFITFILFWASLVVYYTLKHEYHLHNESKVSNQSSFERSPSTIANSLSKIKNFNGGLSKPIKIFSLRLSWNKLFDHQSYQRQSKFNKNFKSSTGVSNCSSETSSVHHTGSNLLMQPLNLDIFEKRSPNDSSQLNMLNNNNQQFNLNINLESKQHMVMSDDRLFYENRHTITSHLPDINMIDPIEITKKPVSSSASSSTSSTLSSATTNKAIDATCGHESIDLSVIDGMKVISMMWLIAAHSLLFFIRNISNGREFWSILKDARFTTIMAGIFPVDTFFTITGILTAYLKLRKEDGKAMYKVRYWLDAFIHRYFRFMPMYLMIYWFTKDVSQYVGNGPLWDYGTANTSLRYTCKSESWAVPIFFGANFKPLNEHCVKPAWYLANDFQYLLLTPFFLILLMRSQILGYILLITIIIVSLALQFLTVFFSNIEDFEVLANFKPMFGTYILSNLWRLYVLPYNRIPPYLIGLLTGHILYMKDKHIKEKQQMLMNYEASMEKRRISTTSYSSSSTNNDDPISNRRFQNIHKKIIQEPNVSGYGRFRLLWSIVVLISIIYLPLVTQFVSQHGLAAKLTSSSLVALMRFFWSIAVARLIFVCATKESSNFITRFLSCSLWKPWAKVGLPALLVQWEIIIYLAQTQRSLPQMNIVYLLGIILMSIVVTYMFAIPIHLIYENPWSSIERFYIHPIFNETSPATSKCKPENYSNTINNSLGDNGVVTNSANSGQLNRLHLSHNVVAT